MEVDKVRIILCKKVIVWYVLYFIGGPTISSIAYNFASSTLTCISSGGPATTVTWTRDNGPVSDSTQQQQLTDTATATYHNLLTITSSSIRNHNGTFRCRVSNSRGDDTQSLDVKGEF